MPSTNSSSSPTSQPAPPPGGIRTTESARASSAVGRALATARCTLWRRMPLRMRRSSIGASSTGSHSTSTTVWANSRSGTVACSAGFGERALDVERQLAAGA